MNGGLTLTAFSPYQAYPGPAPVITGPPPVLVAALGPQMLRLAGRHADGTALWMGGAQYLASDAVPTITAAAREAGRAAPRVVAGLPVCVTDNADAVRAEVNATFARYGQLPSYRAVLDKGGAAGPADVALIGDEAVVLAALSLITRKNSRHPLLIVGLAAMGVPRADALASIRLSLGYASTEADVDTALEVIPRAVEQLRRWNPGLPILAMSRQRAPDVVIKAFADGVSEYLIK